MAKALVLGETKDGKLKKASLEVIHALSTQGNEVDVIVFGDLAATSANEIAKEAGNQGAKKVLTVAGALFNFYQSDAFAGTLTDTFKSGGYQVLAGSASATIKDLFPRMAVRLDSGLAVDCTAIEVTGNEIKARRPMLAGKYFAWVKFKSPSAVISVRPNVLGIGSATAAPASVAAVAANTTNRSLTESISGSANSARPDLTEADRIVSGGRAMKNAENYKQFQIIRSHKFP